MSQERDKGSLCKEGMRVLHEHDASNTVNIEQKLEVPNAGRLRFLTAPVHQIEFQNYHKHNTLHVIR
jgi:hypothetical protein